MRSFQYCCDKVMEFLDFVNASYSTRLLYLRVFRSFGEFLETKDTAVSLEAIEEWIPVSGLSECDTSRCRFILLRLCDVWKYGYITATETVLSESSIYSFFLQNTREIIYAINVEPA